jgi:hypothetical protein
MSTTHWVEVDGAQLAASFSGNATAGLAPLVFLHPGVAHLPSLEAPQAFNAALREFLVGR